VKQSIFNILSLFAILGFCLGMNSIKENDLRLINIYGFAEGLVLDQISGDDCVVKVIQINGDNLYVDTCYATMDEMMTNFEKNGNNFSLKFKENRPQNIKLL